MKRAARIAAIIPAAGASRRMGRSKQTLPVGESTLTATVVRTLLDANVQRVVVITRTSLTTALHLPKDPRVTVEINDDPTSEMIDSIRIGLRALERFRLLCNEPRTSVRANPPALDDVRQPKDRCTSSGPPIADKNLDIGKDACAAKRLDENDGVLVVPGDMPTLSVDTCRRCMEAFIADPRRIVIATHAGKRGHPIIFPLSMGDTVDRLATGLNALPQEHPERVHLVAVDDPGAVADVDTQADYDALTGE